jgi:LPS sulfotransferase NodH
MLVVTGVPRSGTSLLMQLAQAAGMKPVLSGRDGYYEPADLAPTTLAKLHGPDIAIKVLTPWLLPALAAGFAPNQILVADRDADAMRRSQLAYRPNRPLPHWTSIEARDRALANIHDIPMFMVKYEQLLADSLSVCQDIVEFLGRGCASVLADVPDRSMKHY